jgi:hypothetical protein
MVFVLKAHAKSNSVRCSCVGGPDEEIYWGEWRKKKNVKLNSSM